jgi:hypothetical protein
VSEQPATPPGVIPYVEHHTGPRRLVTVGLSAGGTPLAGYSKAMVKPNLFVDGRQYIVYWGEVTVEVPADRSVHIGVGMQDGIRGASVLLPPGSEPVVLDYHVPGMGEASFGPRPAPPAQS